MARNRIIVDEAVEQALETHRRQVYQEVADVIRAAYAESGLSQRAIAKGMNTTSHTPFLKAVSGGNLQLSTIADIAHALGKRVRVILE